MLAFPDKASSTNGLLLRESALRLLRSPRWILTEKAINALVQEHSAKSWLNLPCSSCTSILGQRAFPDSTCDSDVLWPGSPTPCAASLADGAAAYRPSTIANGSAAAISPELASSSRPRCRDSIQRK